MIVLSLAYLEDLSALQRAPETLWLLLCGVPTTEPLALPLLLSGGTLLSFVGIGGLLLLNAPPAAQRQGLVAAGALAVLLVSTVVIGRTFFPPQAPAPAFDRTQLRGSALNPPRAVADFTLMSHTGQPLSLSSLRGSPVLLFFGYTYCPDMCPATLSDFRKVAKQLGPDAERVHFLFISVDGERDTPERLARYVQAFEADMIGLTGAEGEIRRIGTDYGIYFARNKPEPGKAYLVDHTASAYLLNERGELAIVYPFETPPEVITDDLRDMLGK